MTLHDMTYDGAARRMEFEIPPNTQKGEISTIEGFLLTAAKNLGLFQEERLLENPEVGEKVSPVQCNPGEARRGRSRRTVT